jgi:hypothetical protein
MNTQLVNGLTQTVVLVTLIASLWRPSYATDIDSQRPAHGPVLQLGLVGQFGDDASQRKPTVV